MRRFLEIIKDIFVIAIGVIIGLAIGALILSMIN